MAPPVAVGPLRFTLLPLAGVAPPLSIKVAVRPPGVPLKLAAGTNRSRPAAVSTKALAAVGDPTAVQVTPSAEYCQAPWAAVAALAVIATP